jgi:hypothetical protein
MLIISESGAGFLEQTLGIMENGFGRILLAAGGVQRGKEGADAHAGVLHHLGVTCKRRCKWACKWGHGYVVRVRLGALDLDRALNHVVLSHELLDANLTLLEELVLRVEGSLAVTPLARNVAAELADLDSRDELARLALHYHRLERRGHVLGSHEQHGGRAARDKTVFGRRVVGLAGRGEVTRGTRGRGC